VPEALCVAWVDTIRGGRPLVQAGGEREVTEVPQKLLPVAACYVVSMPPSTGRVMPVM
jgi:hypothetical protein